MRGLQRRLAGRSRAVRYGAAFVWLLLIVVPFTDRPVGTQHRSGRGLATAGVLALIAIYVYLFARYRRDARGRRVPGRCSSGCWWPCSDCAHARRAPEWGFLFTYCAARRPERAQARVPGVVVGTTALAAAVSALAGASGGTLLGLTVSTAGVGLLMLVMRDSAHRNEELSCARAELARLAVAQERQRFARDLHDLLGHSLSVIALKAELAGRLLPDRPTTPPRGRRARDGRPLGARRGSRCGQRLSPADARRRARGSADGALGRRDRGRHRARAGLPDPEAEAVLAWAVREGATNVIRHSRASRCSVRSRRGRRRRARGARRRGRCGSPAIATGRATGSPGCPSAPQACTARLEAGRGRRRLSPGGRGPGRPGSAVGGMIRALIAEDQAMVRGALATLLELEPDIEVVAQAARGDEVLAAALAAAPDVALLDIEMPGRAAWRRPGAARRAARLPGPDPHHIRTTRLPAPGHGGRRGRLSAQGRAGRELATAIRRALAGERVVDPGLAAAALAGECPLTAARARGPRRLARSCDRGRSRRRPVPVARDRAQSHVLGACRSWGPATVPRPCARPRSAVGCEVGCGARMCPHATPILRGATVLTSPTPRLW